MLQKVITEIDAFLDTHTTVKAAWRAAVLVTLGMVAKHFGYDGLIADILEAAGT